MNPNNSQPGFELPTPQPSGSGEAMPSKEQQLTPNIEKAPSPGASSAPYPATYQTGPTASAVSTQGSIGVSNTAAPNPVIADDNDLIEKEWVQKAKQIVAETKDDPYRQNKDISYFKADYLKKRYNKDIKVEES